MSRGKSKYDTYIKGFKGEMFKLLFTFIILYSGFVSPLKLEPLFLLILFNLLLFNLIIFGEEFDSSILKIIPPPPLSV